MSILTSNHGPLIVSSTYWGSEAERAGKLWVSVNAGAIRVMIPAIHRAVIEDMRTAREVICSRGTWPAEGKADAVELLFDDGSASPFALHLSPESFDSLPGEPDAGREWVCAVWDLKKGKPHKSLERLCRWRRVDQIPCLQPWGK